MKFPISKNEGLMLTGGLIGGIAAGKYAHSKNHHGLIVAGYAVGAFALSFALTDIVMRKTGIQENRGGFDGIEVAIYAAGGTVLLTVTYIAARLLNA